VVAQAAVAASAVNEMAKRSLQILLSMFVVLVLR
jgi:hypothetical protein